MNLLERHLDQITEQNFTEWIIKDSFKCYASSSSGDGLVQIGVWGTGMFAVVENTKEGNSTYYYKNKGEAISKYKQILRP